MTAGTHASVLLLHTLGAAAAYTTARRLRCTSATARTLAVEAALKSGGLAVVLAKLCCSSSSGSISSSAAILHDISVVPAAVSVVWTAVLGSVAAAHWRKLSLNDSTTATQQ
jgi:predicted Na+-dependent transporter